MWSAENAHIHIAVQWKNVCVGQISCTGHSACLFLNFFKELVFGFAVMFNIPVFDQLHSFTAYEKGLENEPKLVRLASLTNYKHYTYHNDWFISTVLQ